jgi:hypothetical protein
VRVVRTWIVASCALVAAGCSHGGAGAYLVVRTDDNLAPARRVPLDEQFRVYLDNDGNLRTDHRLSLWSWRVLNLAYRLQPKPGSAHA